MLLEHFLIVIRLVHAEIREELAALSDFAEQTATGGVIFLVIFQVISKESNRLGEDGNLNLRGTRVLCMRAVLGDKRLFLGLLDGHNYTGIKIKQFLPRVLRVIPVWCVDRMPILRMGREKARVEAKKWLRIECRMTSGVRTYTTLCTAFNRKWSDAFRGAGTIAA